MQKKYVRFIAALEAAYVHGVRSCHSEMRANCQVFAVKASFLHHADFDLDHRRLSRFGTVDKVPASQPASQPPTCGRRRGRAEWFFMALQRHDCTFNEGLQSRTPPCAFCAFFGCSEAATGNLAPLQMARAFVMLGVKIASSDSC